ncbi:MAG: ImmA/IrrE family metallo-endopeptidase [Afipia sp.]|nr:ImmA/IrrE family metallo-endopeptidase [Afipia sp.]
MIGQRLKVARSASGLSLRDLEDKIDNLVTAQAIGKYERDEGMPSSRVLSALARALSVSEAYLLTAQDMTLDGVEFRRKKMPSKREESFVEGQALHLLERYLTIEDALGLPSVDWAQPDDAPYPVSELATVDNVALSIRRIWGLGIDPIPNVSELFEERGIKILSLRLDDIDGLTASVVRKDGDAIPVIVVKENECGERKRFTLAHELAHMVLESSQDVDAEKAANRFAGAFLMPAEALWAEIGKHRTAMSLGELVELKKKFGASVQAITYRCRELGIFKEPLFKDLFNKFEKMGWRSPPYEEPESMSADKEMPRRMERLCFRALAEKAISESKVAEILGLSVRSLAEKMDQPSLHS